MPDLPPSARVVIIGGGISGCSVAYHLAELGWTDIVLLERRHLTCGTTWHAAGLIGQLRASQNMTRLAKYSADLYRRLEAETGLATGFSQRGSMTVALTAARHEELLRQASMARVFGVEVNPLSPGEVTAMYPHLNTADVVGGVHLPGDGQADPANIALALAKGARMRGARIVEGVKALRVTTDRGRVTGVDWQAGDEQGHIAAAMVVNCGGMWGRDLAAKNGVTLPLHACEHFYIVTEAIAGLTRLPVLRVPDECAYYKEDAGKILLGAFEPVAKPWGMDGIREDFCFDQLPEDFDHFEPILQQAVARMPMLAKAGIHTFFNGPESFTPDDRYYLGEAPEVKGYWVAAGYNSIGIVSSGGAGMALAQWMDAGRPPFDLWEVDIRRAQPFQKNRRYLRERVTETLGLLYADHFPYRQMATARGVRRSALHEHLKARGAVFGEVAGWERANWFAAEGETRDYRYSWGRQNWFPNSRSEHMALREGVGLLDMSSFGKIRVEGRDACAVLNRLCANRIDVAPGRIVYTQMLNEAGGIESDLTVTRLSETAFLLVVPAATLQRDLAWVRAHLGDAFAVVTDISAAEAVIEVMGPLSRDLMARVSPEDFSNAAFPFGTARQIELGLGLARAHRVSYVGELGWELYIPTEQAAHAFEVLEAAGADLGLRLCGLHAMDSCRIEKAYRHFGHDITDEDHVLEAGLGFAVDMDKGPFIGREAVLARRALGVSRRLMQFRLTDPEPLLFHNEPILRDGRIVGQISSGAYGHALGAAIGLGYVPCTAPGESAAEMLASGYQIEVAGRRIAAEASLSPLYDPRSLRVKG
ncbi:4-methylaminobutanoate oxidase (formaldehyde-forming) [Cereibacter ovatus]|uniref:4-methylaminobutanoate oxidase (Formaldehyde-forming) n=1 Tax=Cereibacter ovatus TaxID=439529 RepID=A0A285CU52_9RHOB|nr:FAD-dependent oxidoreductase [Cereibacter ovatus]SNX71100.1 4-methylaminobutanoate oxidase (formaldehyde-forming) [Cereibacter ovatus]